MAATDRHKKCKQCGETFYCSYGIGVGVWERRKFCSLKCSSLAQRNRYKKVCPVCKKEFETTYKRLVCCSLKCRNLNPNAKTKTKGEKHFNYKRVSKKCVMCGANMKVIPARYKTQKVCSKRCFSEYLSKIKTGKGSPFWAGGISFEPYSLGFNRNLKRQIRKRDNYTCQECGYTQDQLGYALPIHHIDYDKKNHKPYNLISLCRTCHCQTNFKRDDWTKYYQRRIGGGYGCAH